VADRLVVAAMKSNQKKYQKSALRITEETFQLLRTSPGMLLIVYYLGSVPFVLGLLYFWADMSRSANAYEYSAAAALALAFLFVWMKVWQTFFTLRVHARISGDPPPRLSPRLIIAITSTQTLIQATRLIVIPIAALLAIPFGYCYAFYHNAAIAMGEDGQDVKSTCQWAWKQAKLWPRQNHLLIGIFWIFGLVIFANVSMAAVIIPSLAKSLLGIESIFSIGGLRMILNSTFLIAILGMTYLLLDPIIKTAYVLRCFYGSALNSGEDLKSELNRFLNRGKETVAGLLVFILCATPFTSPAQTPASVSPDDLNRSIEEIMSRPEFSWRMPREDGGQEEQKARGPIAAAVKWILDLTAKVFKTIGEWISHIFEWLKGLLPEREKTQASEKSNWITPVRMVLIVLLFLFLAIMIFICFRIWRGRQAKPSETSAAAAASVPDLTDEVIKADDLSSNRWLTLAGELAEKGELRLAMRAFYLATLAHLAEHELLTIESYKSNREYELELKRRAHEQKEMIDIFSQSIQVFERAWYGMYRLARSEFDSFAKDQKRILMYAQK